MDYLLAPLFWVLGLIASIVWWVIVQILWIVLWLLLPLAIFAFVVLRVSEKVLGQGRVRAWVTARTQKYGSAASKRMQRWLFALGVLPIRVLFWFPIFALWHSFVSLLWRPKWSPWQRAWAKRWRAEVTPKKTG
jgi:hypothetical protein